MRIFSQCRQTVRVILPLFAASLASAQTFTTLVNFDGSNGAYPAYTSLIQGSDGYLYGTATSGGPHGVYGSIFKMTLNGTVTTLHGFDSTVSGDIPSGTLVEARDGSYYGTTRQGGANGWGNIFRITSAGAISTVYNFADTDGSQPMGGLVQAPGGDFYGTTQLGGTSRCGTAFKITPQGALTTLHNFGGTYANDGCGPLRELVLAANGNFYGVTAMGGLNDQGAVFEMTPAGAVTILYSFSIATSDGLAPQGLVQAAGGLLFGTNRLGGTAALYGTIFSITPAGSLTTLLQLAASNAYPPAPLIQATDGNFYGATQGSDLTNFGTVFRITPGGALATLHAFNSLDGLSPLGGLLQATDGNFYGTTHQGGTANMGVVFKLSVGLAPFVKSQPVFGKVGAAVKILGTNLKGATSVTFNGVPAAFTVVSPSLITTTVPAGAATGSIQVTTPSAVLSSYPLFRVLP